MKLLLAILTDFVGKTSTRVGIISLLVLQALIGTAIAYHLGAIAEVSGGSGILDLETGYDLNTVQSLLDSYGTEGIAHYRWVQLLDIANPFVYSLLFSSICFHLYRQSNWVLLALLPLMIGLFDYFENVFLYLIINSYPELTENLILFSSGLSIIKRGVMLIGVLILLGGVVVWFGHRRNPKTLLREQR